MLKTSYNCEVAEQRSPAQYHVIANSPHIGDTRTKSISKGISTVSVSKRAQMTSKNRDCRRPIFSPTGHMMSSDSLRQMVPVVHVELSSGAKRTENSAQRNIPQINNYNPLQKRPSESSGVVTENIQQQQMHYNNILSIMKDQLNKSINSLQKKADDQTKKNEDAIKFLEKRLKQTEDVLSQKLKQIQKLKQCMMTRTSSSKGKEQMNSAEMNSYLQYISGRMRDLDIKINVLMKQQTLCKTEESRLQSVTKTLEQKIQALGSEFIKMQLNKFNTLSTRVTKFVQSRDKLLQNLISTTEQITKKDKQPNESISLNLQKYQQRLNELKMNHEQIIKTLEKFGSKEYKYDHFELDNLKSQLKRLNSVANKIQNQQNGFKQKQFHSLPAISNQKTNTITSLENFKELVKKPQPQLKTYLMNSKLSFTGNTCSFQDYNPPTPNDESQDQRDHFFYPEQDTSFQRFTDQEQSLMEEQTSDAVVQLADTIKKRKMKMPVKCSINQGYIKLVDAGAYIVDMKGSLMQFSTHDIQTAVGRKLILL